MTCAPQPAPLAVRLLACAVLLGAATAPAGCAAPPELRGMGATTKTSRPCFAAITGERLSTSSCGPTISPPAGHLPLPPPTPPNAVPPTIDDANARDCGGHPSGDDVVALLRRSQVLPSGVPTSIATQPLCADGWQYTVVRVSGHEPLQVVSKGEPDALTLVTAGTDVCVIPVRAGAPPGILTLAC